jgi:D123
MTAVLQRIPVHLQFLPSSHYETKISPSQDPFRHQSLANSHNHHDLHPWGKDVIAGSKEFDALYAQANNRFMYHMWYTPKLAPYMATEVLGVHTMPSALIRLFDSVVHGMLNIGIDASLRLPDGQKLVQEIQKILDMTGLKPDDRIFVRIGATSAKDSFAADRPTVKPSPMPPSGELVVRRLLTSGRIVGRLLALTERIWSDDPGEALVIQRWSPDIEPRRELRAFCYQGRVTAISQNVWFTRLGWREQYSAGFVEAITQLWDKVKDLIPFDTCTMDMLVTPPDAEGSSWKTGIIEFNGFGAHLNTGSDLFHWVKDADILHGKTPGITVRFVDDWEGGKENATVQEVYKTKMLEEDSTDQDWLTLENKVRERYGQTNNKQEKAETEGNVKLPLRGRWCSAY